MALLVPTATREPGSGISGLNRQALVSSAGETFGGVLNRVLGQNTGSDSGGLATSGTQELDDSEQQKLWEACQQFEALFVFQMLQAMRATIPEDGLFGNSMGQNIYKAMLDEQYAQIVAKDGSMGIAKAMYDRLS